MAEGKGRCLFFLVLISSHCLPTSGVLIADTHLRMQCWVEYEFVSNEKGMKKLFLLVESLYHTGVTVCISETVRSVTRRQTNTDFYSHLARKDEGHQGRFSRSTVFQVIAGSYLSMLLC